MKHIAAQLELSIATVSRLLKRVGLSRLSALSPPPPVQRYEYSAPGDLLHLDTKKLGRFQRVGSRITGTHQKRSLGAGFEVTHVCIDDHSRLAYMEVLPNERKETTTGFLVRALDHFQTLGISVARIMTDYGSAYRSHLIADLCRSRRMNGNLFAVLYPAHQRQGRTLTIQTALREWAYARPYDHSQQRAQALLPWLHSYNHHRPHQGIGGQTPISRLPRTPIATRQLGRRHPHDRAQLAFSCAIAARKLASLMAVRRPPVRGEGQAHPGCSTNINLFLPVSGHRA